MPPQSLKTIFIKSMQMKKNLYTLILLLIPVFGFTQENWTEKTRKTLSDKTVENPYNRISNAFNDIYYNQSEISFEEGLYLYEEIFLPFAEKEIKDASQRNYAIALIYHNIAILYDNEGGVEDVIKCIFYIKKGIEYAELSNNQAVCALLYRLYGSTLTTIGDVQMAHDYLYKAINLYESLENYTEAAHCLFFIGENISQIRDTNGLKRVMELLEQYIDKGNSDDIPDILYVLYEVQGIYYSILYEDNPQNSSYGYLSLEASQNEVRLLENNDELRERCGISYPYYNLAVSYNHIEPIQYDSVYFYLNKALDSVENESVENIKYELHISVYLLFAELHFKQKRYEQAEKEMLHVLSLLEQIADYNSVIADYTEAYKFFVTYYETMNRPEEALKYQKLLTENEQRRYENNKIVAMNDMLTKHEVEKKNEQIDRLQERERASRKILILTIFLIVVLLIALLLFFRFYKLRKKSLEQSIYESVLLSELKQNELDQNLREKELLQKQYEELELQTGDHEQKIQSYHEELSRIKRQLEQKPTKTIVDKIAEMISKSTLRKRDKELYITKLSELDIDMMEQGYLTATEKISNMDMKYLICFAIEMETSDISILFNIAPNSIYTVRYRIRKKFGEKNTFQFLM